MSSGMRPYPRGALRSRPNPQKSSRASIKGGPASGAAGRTGGAIRGGGGPLSCVGRLRNAPHLVVQHHLMQLLRRLAHAVAVVRVDDVDQTLRARVVVSPQWSDAVLPSHILRAGAADVAARCTRVPEAWHVQLATCEIVECRLARDGRAGGLPWRAPTR